MNGLNHLQSNSNQSYNSISVLLPKNGAAFVLSLQRYLYEKLMYAEIVTRDSNFTD